MRIIPTPDISRIGIVVIVPTPRERLVRMAPTTAASMGIRAEKTTSCRQRRTSADGVGMVASTNCIEWL